MRLLFLFTAFLLALSAAPQAGAQTSGRRMLRGNVTMPGQPAQAYVIYFENKGGRITGSSVTAQLEGGALTAAITGQFNAAGNEMYLRETHSLDRRSPGSSTYFCYFTARLKLTERNGRRIWSGPFVSNTEDGAPCGGGTMQFVDLPAPPAPRPQAPPARPQPRPQPRPTPPTTTTRAQPRPTPPPVAARPPQPRPQPTPRPAQPRRDTARPRPAPIAVIPPPRRDTARPQPPPRPQLPDTTGIRHLYTWTTDTLGLELWDGYEEDGDVVSLYFNGAPLMTNSQLSRTERRVFALPLRATAIDTLRFELHAEGKIAPCTPRLVLRDGTQRRELNIAGGAGQQALIYFKRFR